MSEDTMLLCPFCGKPARVDEAGRDPLGDRRMCCYPRCATPKCVGNQGWVSFDTRAKAVAAWNQRVAEPLPVGEAKEENYWTKDTPTVAGCWGTKCKLSGTANWAVVWADNDGHLCFISPPYGILAPQSVKLCGSSRLWTKFPLATAADLDGIPDEPDPVEEFKANVTGPFKPECVHDMWIATASHRHGTPWRFRAQNESTTIVLCAALNAWTGQGGDDATPE